MQDLDLLMLPPGWQGITWNETIDPEYKAPVSIDSGKELTSRGNVYLGKKPFKGAPVLLISHNSAFMIANADSEGKFRFLMFSSARIATRSLTPWTPKEEILIPQ